MITKEFKILINHLGWGNPDAILWTIGIEEAGIWSLDKKEEIKKFNKKVIPVSSGKDPKFSIAHPIAKIACGISNSYHNWEKEWRDYRKNKLWKKGSKICNLNIYPLGKKSLKSTFPDDYKELFGINNWQEYVEMVKKERFQKIQEFYKKNQPQAIICYGKSHWAEFEEIFEIDKGKAEEYVDKLTRIYPGKKIILTRHFSNGFRNDICEFLIEKLKEWNVELP
ncbi:hypothetical protein [Desulfurobacterium atlanticum]|uniref:Uracil DNA glycosylase superfamily protein n=1 Tax=Desulfurobacterium atlanticum TaxID=240169 RepID=A0A238Y3T3_9BACT|nr:hypothetical protein [Desulfurobacterium atlanticum]SNR65488.1 hypothetical protein SAMN06265340_10273 [Desulfurobacterium atlanticum]